LKDTRDAYVHRIGKGAGPAGAFGDDAIIVNGFSAVRNILARVFTKTPEFSGKFVYRYLAFWSCGLESPFLWDGSEGDSYYLGLGSVEEKDVVALFAPMAGSFRVEREVVPLTDKPASSAPSTKRKSKPRKNQT
jgi:hypothetical protein